MRSYLAVFCSVSAVGVASVAALNYVVDPYLIHQWDTPQLKRLRPPLEKLSAWGKTYAIARYRPAVLYLGNSRTELALPVRYPAFGAAPVFNGALSGASLGDAAAMARHALALGPLHTVVWGLDAPSFSLAAGALDFERELVARDGAYLPRRALLDLKRALALDMTSDSISLLRGSFGSVCRSNLAYYGQRDERCVADHMREGGGTAAAVRPRLREYVRGAGPSAGALALLDQTVGELCARGTRVRLYLNPVHASMQAALHAAGRWQAMEAWQRRLAGLADRRRAQGCDLRLFDFSGFNGVTTEALPQASGRADMDYYWEPSHYRAGVGRMMMKAMFGGEPGLALPRGFGVELSRAVMAAHQRAQRAARDAYLAAHPVEAALAREAARAAPGGQGCPC